MVKKKNRISFLRQKKKQKHQKKHFFITCILLNVKESSLVNFLQECPMLILIIVIEFCGPCWTNKNQWLRFSCTSISIKIRTKLTCIVIQAVFTFPLT
jgi:hypothetical protein